MAKRRKRRPGTFNFSFVDILATTIGVLLLIIVMAVLNTNKEAFETITFRVPKLRKTDKEPFIVECSGDRVYIVIQKYKLNEADYTASALGNIAFLGRKASASGETYEQACRPQAHLMQAFRDNPPDEFYSVFWVRSSGFPLFIKLREFAMAKGYDYNWRPFDDQTQIIVGIGSGRGGGGNSVQ